MSTAIEHGATRGSRWLRGRRLKVALWVAAIEGLLVVFDVIPKWIAFGVAAAVLVGYLFYGRELKGTRGDVAWVAAASQAFVVLIPILLVILGTLALVAVGILALLALVYLFADRR
jgi:hypothetical protein